MSEQSSQVQSDQSNPVLCQQWDFLIARQSLEEALTHWHTSWSKKKNEQMERGHSAQIKYALRLIHICVFLRGCFMTKSIISFYFCSFKISRLRGFLYNDYSLLKSLSSTSSIQWRTQRRRKRTQWTVQERSQNLLTKSGTSTVQLSSRLSTGYR